jgi:hypothetical protein
LSNSFIVKAGCGKGNFAKIPWICILDREITSHIQEGYYIAILFAEDMSGFYITLNQGFTWFANKFGEAQGRREANKLSIHLKKEINASLGREIDLRSEQNLAKGYEATTIYSKHYNLNNIRGADIPKDIDLFLDLLNKLKEIISADYESFNINMTNSNNKISAVSNINAERYLFTLKRSGKKATLIYDNDKFILQKGSYISTPNLEFSKYNRAYYKMSVESYESLNEDRILIKDVEFSSPTAAAVFANGRFTNGRTDWIDNNGKTISEYMKNDSKNREITLEEFKNFYISNKEEKEISNTEDWIVKANEIIEQFQSEFPLERILNLRLDEYCLGIENSRETLSYYLEFGKYKKIGPWIGGGTVKKHGIYFSASENKYKGPDGVIENIDTYWLEFKKQLYDFIKLFKDDIEPFITKEKFPLLKDMSMVLTKLLYLYYPYKFINISAKQKLNDAFKVFGYELNDNLPTEQLSYLLNRYIRKDLNMYDDENPELLGNAIWNYLLFLNKDNTDDENVQYWLYTPGLSGNMWDKYYFEGIMVIENEGLGNFLELSTKNEIKDYLLLNSEEDKASSLKIRFLKNGIFQGK